MDPIGTNETQLSGWLDSILGPDSLGDFFDDKNGGGIDWWKWEKDVKDYVFVLYPPRN